MQGLSKTRSISIMAFRTRTAKPGISHLKNTSCIIVMSACYVVINLSITSIIFTHWEGWRSKEPVYYPWGCRSIPAATPTTLIDRSSSQSPHAYPGIRMDYDRLFSHHLHFITITASFTIWRFSSAIIYVKHIHIYICHRWGITRGSAAARLLGLRVRIRSRAWMFVCCECCVRSGRGLCDDPIPRPEESYRVWCVTVCDLETSRKRRPWPALGCCARVTTTTIIIIIIIIIIHARGKQAYISKRSALWPPRKCTVRKIFHLKMARCCGTRTESE